MYGHTRRRRASGARGGLYSLACMAVILWKRPDEEAVGCQGEKYRIEDGLIRGACDTVRGLKTKTWNVWKFRFVSAIDRFFFLRVASDEDPRMTRTEAPASRLPF